VNLGRQTATRAAKRLIMLPPFAPAAETWARTTVESNICTKRAVSLIAARASKNASKVRAAQMMEACTHCWKGDFMDLKEAKALLDELSA
jgi:hypothetical protein